ncbi:hypothetical protein [Dactylosporangium sp. NPDC049140]|uniref:hypothetical protein n=1 Tax=Dactylosporangium sp. NPDC049140 TaxID=3155647 RepID=UPI0033C1DB1B
MVDAAITERTRAIVVVHHAGPEVRSHGRLPGDGGRGRPPAAPAPLRGHGRR